MSGESISVEAFGQLPSGEAVNVYVLTNRNGLRLRAMNYGAIVLSLETPDRTGVNADVVLGFNTLDEYLAGSPYFGAVVGRYGNRIAHGRFELDGKTYELAKNNAPGGILCALHGGVRGFDRVFWTGTTVESGDGCGVRFEYESPDGEEGYPGNLKLSVTYWLKQDDSWQIDYRAHTDKATPLNLTQHSFFNLKGEGRGDVLDHHLQLTAHEYTPVDAGMIPTGKPAPVEGTPLDFLAPVRLGDRVDADFEQIQLGRGVDHNFVLPQKDGSLALAARVFEPESRRTVEVWTTEPAVQVYTGNFLDGSLTGKSGRTYGFREGFCLETQHYPDSPNQPHFPSTILRPGSEFKSTTVYKFGRRE